MAAYSLVRGVRLPNPIRRTLYQLTAQVEHEGMDTKICYHSSIELISLWLEKKISQMPRLQEEFLYNPDNCNISYSGINLRTVSLEHEGRTSWALSFIHPDNQVATRLWETQVVVTTEGAQVQLFTEISFSESLKSEEPTPSVPGFVRAISEQVGIVASARLTGKPWVINEEKDIEALHQVVTDPARQLPVVVISSPNRKKWPLPSQPPEYLVSPWELANRCFGRCITVQLTYPASFLWSDKVGRNWSVFDGGIRIYKPLLDFENDDIFSHPLFLKDKILSWDRGCDNMPAAWCFERNLIAEMKNKPTLLLPGTERKTFTALLQRKLELQRQQSITDVEQIRTSYEMQIAALNEEKEYQKELAEDAFQKYQQYEQECEALREKNYNLQCLNDALQEALENSGNHFEDIVEIPSEYQEMPTWCEKYLSSKLEFTNRARRAISKDVDNLYRDVKLVYQCLLFLAEEYRDSKLGKADYSIIEQRLKELQLENRPAVNGTQAGRFEEEYFYTDEARVKHLVEMHLVRGKGRDTRNTLRIYYYWDEKKKKIVIVSLTRHLTTAAT